MSFKATIVLLVVGIKLYSQNDYYSFYKQITDSSEKVYSISARYFEKMDRYTSLAKDTAAIKQIIKKQSDAFNKNIQPLLKGVLGKTFPDISFTDINFETHYLSDYSKNNLVLNYNYL